jgi:hypothetical protein
VNDIATILSQAPLACAPEACRALVSGWSLSPLRDVDAQDLLRTYQIRLVNLQQKPGSHAAQFAQGVSELIANLASAKVAKMTVLSGPAEHDFAIFLSESGSEVLGCLKTVSKLRVSSERLEQLWQGAV